MKPRESHNAPLSRHPVPQFGGSAADIEAEVTLMHTACPNGRLCWTCMQYRVALKYPVAMKEPR